MDSLDLDACGHDITSPGSLIRDGYFYGYVI